MERLIIDIESAAKAKELESALATLAYVNGVTRIHNASAVPGTVYKEESAFFAELDRRTAELENGSVTALSLDDLKAGARALRRNSA